MEAKAKELVKKFRNEFKWVETDFPVDLYRDTKQCALICVDEQKEFINDWTVIDWNIRKIMIDELEKLKEEITKL
tara:strand:+ start:1478 stop:1702 length:225 start_codon:yes stop_codon:yes gene_type:complete